MTVGHRCYGPAEKGQKAMVKLLLAGDGTNPNSKDNNGRTPLSRAAENWHTAVVQLLLATDGVDRNSKDNDGRTPLLWARRKRAESNGEIITSRRWHQPKLQG